MRQRTDSRFDTLKVVMALFIVVLHTKLWPSVFIPLVRIAVPVFFIMSGYFFFQKIYATDSMRQVVGAWSNFLKRSIWLYLFWFVAMLPFTIDIRHRLHLSCDVWSMIYSALTGSTFVASWFIMACIIGITIIFLLRKHLVFATVVSLAAFLLCCEQSSYYGAFNGFNVWFASVFPKYSPVTSFPASLIWICVGAWCARQREAQSEKRVLWGVISVLGLVMLFAEHYWVTEMHWQRLNDCYVSLIVVCPALFMWVKELPPVYYKASLWLRHATVITYCMHGSIAFGLLPVMAKHHITQPLQGVVVFLITMAAVSAASWLILSLSRVKGFKWLKISY